MKQVFLVLFLLQLLIACGEGNTPADENSSGDAASQNTDINTDTSAALANEFCTAQTRLQMVSTGLLSAYSVKGNGSDLNYCGGEITLTEDDPDFAININDYCFNFRDKPLTLNGNITGAIESGANFISEIHELALTGEGVDVSLTGRTWDGRADDMFISITVSDNLSGEDIVLEDVSIKKGELDFGYITLGDQAPIEFKFIEHFNADLTQGQLFFYGAGEELIILTADNGVITVVHKQSKTDPGTLLESSCSG